nr:hypothetical protein [uncultured Sphingosinicella sp.]
MKSKPRLFGIVLIAAFVAWLGVGVSSFSTGMGTARTYDAIAEMWADGPTRSGRTPDEVQLKVLDYRVKAANARQFASQQLTIHILASLVLLLVFERASGEGLSSALRRLVAGKGS